MVAAQDRYGNSNRIPKGIWLKPQAFKLEARVGFQPTDVAKNRPKIVFRENGSRYTLTG